MVTEKMWIRTRKKTWGTTDGSDPITKISTSTL